MAYFLPIRKLIIRLFLGVILFLTWGMRGYAQTNDFTYDNGICGSANIGFHGTISGGSASNYTFSWSFGDGKVDTGADVIHGFPVQPGAIYLVDGVETPFTVTLTTTNKITGGTYSTTKSVIVRPAPIPGLTDAKNPSDPFNNCLNNPTPQRPTFTISVKNNSNDINLISNYLIDWGDGSPKEPYGRNLFPSTLNHTYTTLGLFRLNLTTTGDNGCTAVKEYLVKNQSNPGVGLSTTGSTEGCAPISFSFNLTGIKNNDPETTYLIDFGDGSPTINWTQADALANDTTITHRYTKSSCSQPGKAFTLKVTASNSCKTTPATVGGIKVTTPPIPNFSSKNLCEGENVQFTNSTNVDCSSKVSYIWHFGDGSPDVITTDNIAVPHTFPTDGNVYTVTLTVLSSCQDVSISKNITLIKSPVTDFSLSSTQGCLNSTTPFVVNTTNNSSNYLSLSWSVSPTTGWTFSQGNASSPNPQFSFKKKGIYTIKLTTTNSCKSVIKSTDIIVNGYVNATLAQIKPQCENYTFDASQAAVFKIDSIKNENVHAQWTIIPAGSGSFVPPTNAQSLAPKILFSSNGSYTISVYLKNDCSDTTLNSSFSIGDNAEVTVGPNDTLCASSDLIPLTGNPIGGDWSIQPATASNLIKIIDNQSFFDPSVPGDYTLTYTRGIDYCAREAHMNYLVKPLPVVDAGLDFTICMNETNPYTLKGTPVGGIWTGLGVTGNTFSPSGLNEGSYILKYSYTDPNTLCSNTDQLVVRVLAVPITGFNTPIQGCKDQPVTFTPFGEANTIFNWDFGDGQTASSSGPIIHTYRNGGTYTVNLVSADQNNCVLNTSKKISIQDTISMPVVTPTPTTGCGPLTITFTIDTTGTTGNGQKHQWDFGNGIVINDALTSKTIIYNSGLSDTVYTVKLIVSNNCYTKTNSYPITIKSKPNADFRFPHPWECSPALVKIRNIAADRNASFLWDFGDGTTSTDFEPTHLFTTGKIATTFTIKLVANNGCGKDSMTRTLLVKPNSIEVFIEMSARLACPGDVITFKNLTTDTVSKISSFYWNFGDGTIVNTWDATHVYTTPGKYSIKLYVDNGCSQAEKTEQIEILPIPDLQIISVDSICKDDTLKLEGNPNGVDLINAKWDFGDGSISQGTKTYHIYNTTGWYTITYSAAFATSILRCNDLKTKRVYVKEAVSLPSFPDMVGCSPFSISIPSPGTDAYLWNYGDDNSWTSSSKHTYINTEVQLVRRKVTIIAENNFACKATSSFWVTIYPTPVAKISARSEGGYPETVYFKNLSTNAATCEWLFPDGSTTISCDSIMYRFYNNGTSRIYLRTSNQYGCTDTTSIVHETVMKGLFVPNALQPSNSDPLVKIFKPIGIGLKTYHLGIYDIWGNSIWETEKINDTETEEGWNGQSKSGKDLPQGVYIWRITATFIDGTSWKGMKQADNKTRTEGTITLIR